jgi:hypothetical protein
VETHSGLLQVDVDKIGAEHASTLRDALRGEPSAFAAWVSPSGNGVKVLIRISADIARHAESYPAVEKLFLERWQVAIDPKCKDVSRLCFVSHDPDLWINSDAIEIELEELSLEEKGNLSKSKANILLNPETLNSESCTLDTTPQNELEKDPPPKGERKEFQFEDAALASLFHVLVRSRAGTVRNCTRNAHICEMVPLLYSAVSEEVLRLFVAEFHRENAGAFKDPIAQTMQETESLLRGVAQSYLAALSPNELTVYENLDPTQQLVFRICRGLSRVQTADRSPGEFFLSDNQLGFRTGLLSTHCGRLKELFVALGILEMVTKGTQHMAGKRGIATVYRFNLP